MTKTLTAEEVKAICKEHGFDPRKIEFFMIGEDLYHPVGEGVWEAYPPQPPTAVVH